MQSRFTSVAVAVVLVLAGGSVSSAAAQAAFDPHDLSGIWNITRGHRSISANVPPMTPEGASWCRSGPHILSR